MRRGAHRALFLVAAALLAGGTVGCAESSSGSQSTTAASVSGSRGDEAHADIARLEQKIAHLEAKLGLPPASPAATPSLPEQTPAMSPTVTVAPPPGTPYEEKAVVDPTAHSGSVNRPSQAKPQSAEVSGEPTSPAPPVAPAPAEAPRTAKTSSDENMVLTVGARRRSWRCRRVDDTAGQICEASERICRIAENLAGELEAARSCTHAREECGRARNLAGGCQ